MLLSVPSVRGKQLVSFRVIFFSFHLSPLLKPPCLKQLHWVSEDICGSKPDWSCLFRLTYQLKSTPWLKLVYNITLNWWIVTINVHIVGFISQEISPFNTNQLRPSSHHQFIVLGSQISTKASVSAKTTTPAHSQRMAQASKSVTCV